MFPEFVPYELIGKVVFAVVVSAIAVLIVLMTLATLAALWYKGFVWVSNRMWKGHDHKNNRPPLWKMRISGVALALGKGKFNKVIPAYKEAQELAGDETTFIEYLKSVFVDE